MAASNIAVAPEWVRPDASILEGFRRHSVANIGDAMGRLNIVDAGIQPIWHGAKAVGSALPVMSVGGDNLAVIEALDYIQPGDLLVINAQGFTGRAILGDNLAQRFEVFGATGVVLDGCARDRDIIEELGFPVFARGLTPAGPFKNGPGSIGEPVAIGGVVANAGDIVAADSDGIIVVRRGRAEEVLAAVEEIVALESAKDAEAAAMRASRR